jgi:RecG-like helicase
MFHCAGKTLMLILQGLRWLREGRHVLIIAPTDVPQPYAEQIVQQFHAMMPSSEGPPALSIYYFDLDDENMVTRALTELTNLAKSHGNQLYILMDEVVFDKRYGKLAKKQQHTNKQTN